MESDQPDWGIKFPPNYADCIAHAANSWAHIEYHVDTSIWALADLKPSMGACLTGQIINFNSRLSALVSLLKVRKANQTVIDKVNRFMENVRDAQDARNRIVHDGWLIDSTNPQIMGKLQITANRKLNFTLASIDIQTLRKEVEKIHKRREEITAIRQLIYDELPRLPEMTRAELYPITENRSGWSVPPNDE